MGARALEDLLDDVGGEFVATEANDMREELDRDRISFGARTAVLRDDELNDVVTEWVSNDIDGAFLDLSDDAGALLGTGVFQAALNNAAALLVHGNLAAVRADSIEDEFLFFPLETLENFLDDVVSVDIGDESEDVRGKSTHQNLGFVAGCDGLDELLNGEGTVRSHADLADMGLDDESYLDTDRIGHDIEQLLLQKVCVLVCHEFSRVRDDLGEDETSCLAELAKLRGSAGVDHRMTSIREHFGDLSVKNALQVTAAELILGGLVDATFDGLDSDGSCDGEVEGIVLVAVQCHVNGILLLVLHLILSLLVRIIVVVIIISTTAREHHVVVVVVIIIVHHGHHHHRIVAVPVV